MKSGLVISSSVDQRLALWELAKEDQVFTDFFFFFFFFFHHELKFSSNFVAFFFAKATATGISGSFAG